MDFIPFGCICDHSNAIRNSGQNVFNTFFGAFYTIWVRLGPFGCLTKLGAKRAELVQKFVPQSRVGILHNERTRSNPRDPKLTFWCISYYLGAFGTIWLPYETRWKTSRTSAKVCATKSHRNFSQRMHTIQCKLGGKRSDLVQKFVPRICIRIFRNEHT